MDLLAFRTFLFLLTNLAVVSSSNTSMSIGSGLPIRESAGSHATPSPFSTSLNTSSTLAFDSSRYVASGRRSRLTVASLFGSESSTMSSVDSTDGRQHPAFTSNLQPAFTTSVQPAITLSAQPAISTSVQPAFTSSVQPAFTTSVQPAISTTVQLAFTSRVQPASATSVQSAFTNNVQPAITSSVQPAITFNLEYNSSQSSTLHSTRSSRLFQTSSASQLLQTTSSFLVPGSVSEQQSTQPSTMYQSTNVEDLSSRSRRPTVTAFDTHLATSTSSSTSPDSLFTIASSSNPSRVFQASTASQVLEITSSVLILRPQSQESESPSTTFQSTIIAAGSNSSRSSSMPIDSLLTYPFETTSRISLLISSSQPVTSASYPTSATNLTSTPYSHSIIPSHSSQLPEYVSTSLQSLSTETSPVPPTSQFESIPTHSTFSSLSQHEILPSVSPHLESSTDSLQQTLQISTLSYHSSFHSSQESDSPLSSFSIQPLLSSSFGQPSAETTQSAVDETYPSSIMLSNEIPVPETAQGSSLQPDTIVYSLSTENRNGYSSSEPTMDMESSQSVMLSNVISNSVDPWSSAVQNTISVFASLTEMLGTEYSSLRSTIESSQPIMDSTLASDAFLGLKTTDLFATSSPLNSLFSSSEQMPSGLEIESSSDAFTTSYGTIPSSAFYPSVPDTSSSRVDMWTSQPNDAASTWDFPESHFPTRSMQTQQSALDSSISNAVAFDSTILAPSSTLGTHPLGTSGGLGGSDIHSTGITSNLQIKQPSYSHVSHSSASDFASSSQTQDSSISISSIVDRDSSSSIPYTSNTTVMSSLFLSTQPPDYRSYNNLTLVLYFRGNCKLIKGNTFIFRKFWRALLQYNEMASNKTISQTDVSLVEMECNPFHTVVSISVLKTVNIAQIMSNHFNSNNSSSKIFIRLNNGTKLFVTITSYEFSPSPTGHRSKTGKTLSEIVIISLASVICGILVAIGVIIAAREYLVKRKSDRFRFDSRDLQRGRAERVALRRLSSKSNLEMRDNGSVSGSPFDVEYSTISSHKSKQTSFVTQADMNQSNRSLSKKWGRKSANTAPASSSSNGITNSHSTRSYGLVIGLLGYKTKPSEPSATYAVPDKKSKVQGLSIHNVEKSTGKMNTLPGDKRTSSKQAADNSPIPPARRLRTVSKNKETTASGERLVPRATKTEGAKTGGVVNLAFSDDDKKDDVTGSTSSVLI